LKHALRNKLNKKIYFIRSNKTKFGGAENYLFRLSKALSKLNIDYQIINSCYPKILPSWLRAILFNIHVTLTKRNKFYFSLERISCPDIYRAGDGVHKVFLSIENKSIFNLLHPVYLALEKKCFRNAKIIIANSRMVKNQIINTYGVSPKKIKVIHNGIELKDSNYRKSYEKLSTEFKLEKNQPIVLFTGNGFKRKGLREFLEIISKLKTKNVKAFVIGKDKNINHYLKLSKELKINSKVIFTGPREDIDDFYSISDIFLFPTHYDPFSNVVLEAMNFNNVVFTSSNNGASEILEDYFIMISPNDFSVVNKIDELLQNKDRISHIKQLNLKKSKKLSIEKNLSSTLNIIDEIIN
jgi:UDP-glucose:(heptosyl)LPS alpha-1,3-glucosyltransferase